MTPDGMANHLDVLAVAAHPDDVELSCGGVVCRLIRDGYRVGIVDLTRGELGTRGTPEIRAREAETAGKILGVHARDNLGMPDGNIENSPENRSRLIRVIRRYRPHILLINAPEDRHADHPAASRLAIEAQFYAGLSKIETSAEGETQEPWRPMHVLHYMQSVDFEPTFVVDVSDVWERRMQAMLAFESQFESREAAEEQGEPSTYISTPHFLQFIEARARTLGFRIGARFGEGLLYHQGPIGVDDLYRTLERSPRR